MRVIRTFVRITSSWFQLLADYRPGVKKGILCQHGLYNVMYG
jgi:hypothetical protein